MPKGALEIPAAESPRAKADSFRVGNADVKPSADTSMDGGMLNDFDNDDGMSGGFDEEEKKEEDDNKLFGLGTDQKVADRIIKNYNIARQREREFSTLDYILNQDLRQIEGLDELTLTT